MKTLIALRPHVDGFVPRRRGDNGALVRVNVIKFWPRSLLRLAYPHWLAGQQLRDLAVTGVEISRDDGVLRADHNTGRLQSNFGAVGAEMAFGRGAFVRIDVDGIVWAGLHAGFAPDTSLGAEINDAVFALVHRGHRTDRDAGRILAMIAARDLKDAAGVGESSLLDVLHPGAVHGERDVVLGLARHRAGVAADALAVIDDESVSHPERFQGSIEALSGLAIVSENTVEGSDGAHILESRETPFQSGLQCRVRCGNPAQVS